MVDNSVGGLQVLRDGVWYDVPTRPHTLLINLGDQIEVMRAIIQKHLFVSYNPFMIGNGKLKVG
jgi:hypothetical protein